MASTAQDSSSLPLTPLGERVLAQTLAFEAALPELRAAHEGRWAVWLDGLRGVHGSHAEAAAWAAQNLPAGSGYVVARIAERRPVELSPYRFRP